MSAAAVFSFFNQTLRAQTVFIRIDPPALYISGTSSFQRRSEDLYMDSECNENESIFYITSPYSGDNPTNLALYPGAATSPTGVRTAVINVDSGNRIRLYAKMDIAAQGVFSGILWAAPSDLGTALNPTTPNLRNLSAGPVKISAFEFTLPNNNPSGNPDAVPPILPNNRIINFDITGVDGFSNVYEVESRTETGDPTPTFTRNNSPNDVFPDRATLLAAAGFWPAAHDYTTYGTSIGGLPKFPMIVADKYTFPNILPDPVTVPFTLYNNMFGFSQNTLISAINKQGWDEFLPLHQHASRLFVGALMKRVWSETNVTGNLTLNELRVVRSYVEWLRRKTGVGAEYGAYTWAFDETRVNILDVNPPNPGFNSANGEGFGFYQVAPDGDAYPWAGNPLDASDTVGLLRNCRGFESPYAQGAFPMVRAGNSLFPNYANSVFSPIPPPPPPPPPPPDPTKPIIIDNSNTWWKSISTIDDGFWAVTTPVLVADTSWISGNSPALDIQFSDATWLTGRDNVSTPPDDAILQAAVLPTAPSLLDVAPKQHLIAGRVMIVYGNGFTTSALNQNATVTLVTNEATNNTYAAQFYRINNVQFAVRLPAFGSLATSGAFHVVLDGSTSFISTPSFPLVDGPFLNPPQSHMHVGERVTVTGENLTTAVIVIFDNGVNSLTFSAASASGVVTNQGKNLAFTIPTPTFTVPPAGENFQFYLSLAGEGGGVTASYPVTLLPASTPPPVGQITLTPPATIPNYVPGQSYTLIGTNFTSNFPGRVVVQFRLISFPFTQTSAFILTVPSSMSATFQVPSNLPLGKYNIRLFDTVNQNRFSNYISINVVTTPPPSTKIIITTLPGQQYVHNTQYTLQGQRFLTTVGQKTISFAGAVTLQVPVDSIDSDTSLKFTTPTSLQAPAGTYNLRVITTNTLNSSDPISVTLTQDPPLLPAPILLTPSPQTYKARELVTLRGQNFFSAVQIEMTKTAFPTIDFSLAPASVAEDGTSLQVIMPAPSVIPVEGIPYLLRVSLTNSVSTGYSGTISVRLMPSGFIPPPFPPPAPPVLTEESESSGPVGDSVVLSGNNFSEIDKVRFFVSGNPTPVWTVDVFNVSGVGGTSLSFTVPNLAVGTYFIEVWNSETGDTSEQLQFDIVVAPPVPPDNGGWSWTSWTAIMLYVVVGILVVTLVMVLVFGMGVSVGGGDGNGGNGVSSEINNSSGENDFIFSE